MAGLSLNMLAEYVGVQGDEEAMRTLLASSGRVLAHVVDENRRR